MIILFLLILLIFFLIFFQFQIDLFKNSDQKYSHLVSKFDNPPFTNDSQIYHPKYENYNCNKLKLSYNKYSLYELPIKLTENDNQIHPPPQTSDSYFEQLYTPQEHIKIYNPKNNYNLK